MYNKFSEYVLMKLFWSLYYLVLLKIHQRIENFVRGYAARVFANIPTLG